MRLLHIFKSEQDEDTRTLMGILSEGEETDILCLYEEDADYEKLIEMTKDFFYIIIKLVSRIFVIFFKNIKAPFFTKSVPFA